MSYYIARSCSRPFESVVSDVIAQLKTEGFGVLTDIDVQATLHAKIGVTVAPYRILGACNPQFAYEALKIEDKLGILLPCNVIVRQTEDGKVEVATVDPVLAMQRTGNAKLEPTAHEVRRRLVNVLLGVAP